MNDRSVGRPRRETYLILGLILAAGLVIRLICLPYIYAPFPADAQYYYHVAENIAEGRGVVTDYVWIYARGVPDSLPMPANGYWMPGMSLYLVPWFKLFGVGLIVGKLANVLLAVVFLALIWWVGRELTGSDGAALLGAALAAVDPYFVSGSTTPDASLPQGLFAAGCLLCMYYGVRKHPNWLALSGLLGGLAHFMRNDGALLLPVFGLYCIAAYRGRWHNCRPRHLLYFLVPYALVVAPWLIRNTIVFGSPSPPELSRLVHLPKYLDIFRADLSTITVSQWLERHDGLAGVLAYDILVFARIIEWLVGKGVNALLLFIIPFLWLRRTAVARPYLYMFGVLMFVYTFVMPEVGVKGSYTRSFPSLYPLIFATAGGGVWMAGQWLADRWKRVSRPLALAVCSIAVLAFAFTRMGLLLTHQYKQVSIYPYIANADLLRAFFATSSTPDLPVLTDDPWCLNWVTKRKGLMMPAEGMEMAREISRKLNARYLILPGKYRKTYPEITECIEDGTLSAVRAMPTLAAYGGLQIFDLWLTEGRRLNTEGMQAAEQGDYPRAIQCFAAAAKLVRDYERPSRVMAENLTKAHYRYGRQLEKAGKLNEALAQFHQAEEKAPPGYNIDALIAHREGLERRLNRRQENA
jgi:4-amino-4-deoxy-L-arabinose transferase-like glycosyltransferase